MEKQIHYISPEKLTWETMDELVKGTYSLVLSDDAKTRINRCRNYLDTKMKNQKEPIYGISTGFGSLCDYSISKDQLSELQRNLIISHACGTGDEVEADIVRLMLFLKIHALSLGHSGVQIKTVERIIDFYNEDVLPVVYSQGSLGASGDLAPLAHLFLPLIGLGEVYYKGEKVSADKMLKDKGWEPITLQSKEGLALLNGTQFMSAFGTYCCIKVGFLIGTTYVL